MFSNSSILQARQLRLGKIKAACSERYGVRDGTDLGLNFLVCFLSTSHSAPRVAKGVGTGVPAPKGRDGTLPSSTLAAGGGGKLWLQA